MIVGVPLRLLNELVALLDAETLKPVSVAGILVGRRRLIVDILANIVVFETQTDNFVEGVDCEFRFSLLILDHLGQ